MIKPVFTHLLVALFAMDLVESFTTTTTSSRSQLSTFSLSATVDESKDLAVDPSNVGLYRRFSDHVIEKLQESGMFETIDDLPSHLTLNQATQNRGGKSSMVQIQNFAMKPVEGFEDVVRYSRVALLETIDLSAGAEEGDSAITTHTEGIQVLNFIIVPSAQTDLPVLGIDLVRLPGDKNLLLLDAQPMVDPNPYQERWKEWHAEHVNGDAPVFSWGGDFPPLVQQYVSPYALWTRLQPPEDVSEDDWGEQYNPTSVIQNELWDAFTSHLEIYLDLLKQHQRESESSKSNNQAGYLEYRRTTDPAKPMLKALYGEDWTQEVLDQVLFPTWME